VLARPPRARPRARARARAKKSPRFHLSPPQGFFTTREACLLRLVNAELRAAVAAFPWLDVETPVASVAPWAAAHPRALAANVGARALSGADEALLGRVPVVVPLRGAPVEGDVRAWRAAHAGAAAASLRGRGDVGDADVAALRGVRALSLVDCAAPRLTPAALDPLLGGLLWLDAAGAPLEFVLGLLARPAVAASAGALLGAVRALRHALSRERDPPIAAVVRAGAVPRLVAIVAAAAAPPALVLEACWALTNLAAGATEHTRAVVDAGAVAPMVALLASPVAALREQAVWGLGNVAGDEVDVRDAVLAGGAVGAIARELARPGCAAGFRRHAAWCASNLVRRKPYPPGAAVAPLLPALAALLGGDDAETLADACWALSYLSDGANERIDAVVRAGVLPRVAELARDARPNIATPALRALGNVVTGDEAQTQAVVDAGGVQAAAALLASPRAPLRKEAVWLLSNVFAGSSAQVEAAFETVPAIVALMAHERNEGVRKECAWALSNVATQGTAEQCRRLLGLGATAVLKGALAEPRLAPLVCKAVDALAAHGGDLVAALEGAGVPEALVDVAAGEDGEGQREAECVGPAL